MLVCLAKKDLWAIFDTIIIFFIIIIIIIITTITIIKDDVTS